MPVLAEQDSAAAQQYIRQGSPTALRAELWALILNISSQPEVRRKKGWAKFELLRFIFQRPVIQNTNTFVYSNIYPFFLFSELL